MKIERVTLMKDYRLGPNESTSTFIAKPPHLSSPELPIPDKFGIAVHLVAGGAFVLVEEVPPQRKDDKGKALPPPRAPGVLLIPRERVESIHVTPEQAAEMIREG